MELTTTGISGLDAQLGGGIPRGSTLLLLSEPGNAIGAFAEQFAGGGVNGDEHVLFYEFDRPADGLRESIGQFVQGNPGKGAEALRVFDGYSPQFGRKVPADADVTPVDRRGVLPDVLNELHGVSPDRPHRLVVETLSSTVEPGKEEAVVDFVRNVVYLTRETGGTTLFTLVSGLHDPQFETRLEHLVDGVLEMGVEKKGFGLYSYLVVKKMLGVPDPVRILLFKQTDKGLWLESTKRVF